MKLAAVLLSLSLPFTADAQSISSARLGVSPTRPLAAQSIVGYHHR